MRYRLKRCRKRAPEDRHGRRQRVERHHRALLVAHEQEPEVAHLLPELGLRLHGDLVIAAESREVVDLVAAEEGLHRGEHVVDRHAELLDLLAVDLEAVIGGRGGEGRRDAADLRPLLRGRHELPGDRGQFLGRLSAARLQHHRESGHRAEPGQRRRVERHDDRFRQAARSCGDLADDRRGMLVLPRALIPGLQAEDQKGAVRRSRARDQVVAGDHLHVRHTGDRPRDLLYLARDRDRSLLRGALGQDDLGENGALVLVGDEAGGRDALQAAGREDHRAQDREHDRARGARRVPRSVRSDRWCDRRCG